MHFSEICQEGNVLYIDFFKNKKLHFLYDCITIFRDTLYAHGILLEGIRVLFPIRHPLFRSRGKGIVRRRCRP